MNRVSKRPVVQVHHLMYGTEKQPEITVRIFKGEHWLATNLNRRKNISKGWIKYLKFWIALHEDEAKEIPDEKKT